MRNTLVPAVCGEGADAETEIALSGRDPEQRGFVKLKGQYYVKASLHVVFHKLKMVWRDQQQFWAELKKEDGEDGEDGELVFGTSCIDYDDDNGTPDSPHEIDFDRSIYGNNRNLVAINQGKPITMHGDVDAGIKTAITQANSNQLPIHVVQMVTAGCEEIVPNAAPPPATPTTPSKSESKPPPELDDNDQSYELVSGLLEIINANCKYDKWFRIGCFLKGEGSKPQLPYDYREDFCKWSESSDNTAHTYDGAAELWDGIDDSHPNPVKLGTLIYFAKLDDPEKVKQLYKGRKGRTTLKCHSPDFRHMSETEWVEHLIPLLGNVYLLTSGDRDRATDILYQFDVESGIYFEHRGMMCLV
eukprot:COSAG05_NODE_3835_length_1813_cov_1.521004_1_plen_359_part_00